MRLRLSKAEVEAREEEIAAVQLESARQRREALGLLGVARITGEALRKSRARNHYGQVLGDLFDGRRSA